MQFFTSILTKKLVSDKAKALMLARRQMAELVCDAVNLEGIAFTLAGIQTLLDGVTIGGINWRISRLP